MAGGREQPPGRRLRHSGRQEHQVRPFVRTSGETEAGQFACPVGVLQAVFAECSRIVLAE